MIISRTASFATVAAACLLALVPAAAQTSIGLVAAGEFGSRTVGSAADGLDNAIDALREANGFVFAPGVGVIAERKFSGLFSVSAQLRYSTAGYTFDGSAAPEIDPLTGVRIIDSRLGSIRYRYTFLSLAVGASEVWGAGRVRFYAEEYLVPMLLLSSSTESDDTVTAGRARPTTNDFHIGVRGGVGAQVELAANLRLRLGVTANYHFTQTFDDIDLREHLFAFGPEVSLLRVFGAAGTPEGPAEEIYY